MIINYLSAYVFIISLFVFVFLRKVYIIEDFLEYCKYGKKGQKTQKHVNTKTNQKQSYTHTVIKTTSPPQLL